MYDAVVYDAAVPSHSLHIYVRTLGVLELLDTAVNFLVLAIQQGA